MSKSSTTCRGGDAFDALCSGAFVAPRPTLRRASDERMLGALMYERDDTTSVRPIHLILNKLERVRKCGRGWVARCPAHDDHSPSLSLSEGVDNAVLIHCFAGCLPERIAEALDLPWSAFFSQDSVDFQTRAHRQPRASVMRASQLEQELPHFAQLWERQCGSEWREQHDMQAQHLEARWKLHRRFHAR